MGLVLDTFLVACWSIIGYLMVAFTLSNKWPSLAGILLPSPRVVQFGIGGTFMTASAVRLLRYNYHSYEVAAFLYAISQAIVRWLYARGMIPQLEEFWISATVPWVALSAGWVVGYRFWKWIRPKRRSARKVPLDTQLQREYFEDLVLPSVAELKELVQQNEKKNW